MDVLPKTVIVPVGVNSEYLTSCKEYDVIEVKMELSDDCLFVIICDDGETIDCKLNACGHLGGKDWVVVPDGVYLQACESCEGFFDVETMQQDSGGYWMCEPCYTELAPVMQKEYEEMVARGEIDPDEYHA